MTEIGIGTLVPLDATDMVGRDSCGITAPCREFTIRDDEGQPVPVGEPGRFGSEARGCFWGITNAPKRIARALSGIGFGQGI